MYGYVQVYRPDLRFREYEVYLTIAGYVMRYSNAVMPSVG